MVAMHGALSFVIGNKRPMKRTSGPKHKRKGKSRVGDSWTRAQIVSGHTSSSTQLSTIYFITTCILLPPFQNI